MGSGVRLTLLACILLASGGTTWAEDFPEDEIVRKARVLRQRADAHQDARRVEQAVSHYRKAIRLLRARGGDHEELATTLNNLGYLLDAVGKTSEAHPLYEEALKIRRRLVKGDHFNVIQSLDNLASTLSSLGKEGEALPLYEEALKIRRRLFKGDHSDVAKSLNNVGYILDAIGRASEALPLFEEALKMRRRLFKGDHPDVALSLNNLGHVLEAVGRATDALPRCQESLEMRRRLFEGDHPDVAWSLNSLASVLETLGKPTKALPLHEEALKMFKRLYKGDHPLVAQNLNNLAYTLNAVGKASEALPLFEEALEMRKRLFKGDHPDLATSLNNLAHALDSLGKASEARPLYEEALKMRRRLFKGDHPVVAQSLNNLAYVLDNLGKVRQAQAIFEEALEMRRRLFNGDHAEVAQGLNNLAHALDSLGRAGEALPLYEEALKMYRRLFKGDHPDVALSLSNLANMLRTIGKADEARPLYEEALAMYRRLFKGDHPDVVWSLGNLAYALRSLGKEGQALPLYEEALAMTRRLFKGDHPDVAVCLNNLAAGLSAADRASEAVPLYEEALRMLRRLYKGDHPDVAQSLLNMASVLADLNRRAEAREIAQEAIQVGEGCQWPGSYTPRVLLGRLYLLDAKFDLAIQVLESAATQLETRRAEAVSLGSEGRSQYLANLRDWDPFPLLVKAHVRRGEPERALEVLERSRGREMLDLLKRGEGDPLRAALASARESGDEALVTRIQDVQRLVQETASRVAAASNQAKRARKFPMRTKRGTPREAERAARRAHADALRERLRMVRDALPEGRPLLAEEMKALLSEGERMVAFSLGEPSFVFVISRDDVHAHALGTEDRHVTSRAVAEAVAVYRNTLSRAGATPTGASEHPGAALFRMLMPDVIWQDVKGASRVYLLPHASLHQLPFEALVVRASEDKPVYWLQEGPPVAYAASAAVLGALRARPGATSPNAAVVAVGDPLFDGVSQWPEVGVVITGVAPKTQAAAASLRPGDVITSYGETPTPALEDLLGAVRGTDATGEAQVTLEFERDGKTETVSLKPGRIGVMLAEEPPPIAGPKVLQNTAAGVIRGAHRGRLRPLPGTREEVNALATLVRQSKRRIPVGTLLGAEATEGALFETSNSPRILHLATHGLIEPDLGARASRLALTPPRVPVPGNDGFLSLGDLLERWRARLKGTELVVLSACESHAGKLDTNEGMLALPWGFCFAGARSCIASLWHVDDVSTAKLMTSLYRGLFEGDDFAPCEALHAARLSLFKTHPDPYHWAPFLFVGAPQR